MPRKPGTRIEAADTLGRKCWAMAYLAQTWQRLSAALMSRLHDNQLSIAPLDSSFNTAIPLTMSLCQDVVCNVRFRACRRAAASTPRP